VKTPRFYALLLLPAALFQAATVSATVVFSSLDIDGLYDTTTASAINGSSFRYGYQAWANQFIPSSSGALSSIELAVHYDLYESSPADQVDVRLALDNNDPVYGHLPSANNLASGSVTTPTSFGSYGLVTFTPSTLALLTAGTRYWVVVAPHFTTTGADWNVTSIGAMGAIALSLNGSTRGQNPNARLNAFRVNTGPVPEPSSLALVVMGLGGMFWLRRRAHWR
jgi:hypothetical protein